MIYQSAVRSIDVWWSNGDQLSRICKPCWNTPRKNSVDLVPNAAVSPPCRASTEDFFIRVVYHGSWLSDQLLPCQPAEGDCCSIAILCSTELYLHRPLGAVRSITTFISEKLYSIRCCCTDSVLGRTLGRYLCINRGWIYNIQVVCALCK